MQALHLVTPEEYFALDADSEERLEYWSGEIVAMAGETDQHSAVKDNLVAALRSRTPCDVRSSGLRVHAPGFGRANYAYPDAIVTCDEKKFDTRVSPPTLLNPTLLVEVTSESTRRRDTGDKLGAYFRLESLLEYWIVDPERPQVLRYTRAENGVLVHLVNGLDQDIRCDALDLSVPMAECYRRVLS